MSRRRHQLQVNTFPFLAVLLCAMGSLILVLLVMDRRSHLAARARAVEQQRQQSREHAQAKSRRRDDFDAKKRARDAAWEKKRDALRAKVSGEEKALSAELREVQDRLARTAERLEAEEVSARKLRDQVKDEQGRVSKQEELLDTSRKEASALADKAASADKARARLAGELVQLEKHLAELKQARQRDEQSFSVVPYHGKRGDARRPLYVECAERGFVLHPDQQRLDAPSEEALKAELTRRIARNKDERAAAGDKDERPYLMLLVRPDGIRRFYELQAAARKMSVDFGYEFVNADWKFHIPEDSAPQKQVNAETPRSPGVRLVPPAPSSPPGSNIGLTRPVPYGTELPPITSAPTEQVRPAAESGWPGLRGPSPGGSTKAGERPRGFEDSAPATPSPLAPAPDGPVVSMHRPVNRPSAAAEDGIPTPALLPAPAGQSLPPRPAPVNPPAAKTHPGEGESAGPRLGPAGAPGGSPLPLRPAQISGVREVVLFVECRSDVVVVYPSRLQVSVDHLTHSAMHNKLFQTVRQLVTRQQGTGAKVQVRFLIHPDAERTFHKAYPVLEGLPVPKAQYNLMPDDDVARIVAGY